LHYQSLYDEIERRLKQKRRVVVAIDGKSGAGKSSFSGILKQKYNECNVVSMDEFFLRSEQRTPERFMEPGGNVDYERFVKEIALPLKSYNAFSYRPFCCKTMSLTAEVNVVPTSLTVIEGVYCLHPHICDANIYDIKIFFCIDEDSQKHRLHRRDPKLFDRFVDEWIPMENNYFRRFDIQKKCDFVFKVTDK